MRKNKNSRFQEEKYFLKFFKNSDFSMFRMFMNFLISMIQNYLKQLLDPSFSQQSRIIKLKNFEKLFQKRWTQKPLIIPTPTTN